MPSNDPPASNFGEASKSGENCLAIINILETCFHTPPFLGSKIGGRFSSSTKSDVGMAPSTPMKLCRLVKPVPSVLTANTVPAPELPPSIAVPYSVLPDNISPECG